MVSRLGLVVCLLAACGPEVPDENEVYDQLRRGGNECIDEVQALGLDAPWLTQFELDFAEPLRAYIQQLALKVTQPVDVIEIVFEPTPGVRFSYYEELGSQSDFGFSVEFDGHRLSSSISTIEIERFPRTSKQLSVDGLYKAYISNDISCISPAKRYSTTSREDTATTQTTLWEGNDFWGAYAKAVSRYPTDNYLSDSYSGEVCHGNLCRGVPIISMGLARATHSFGPIIPVFVDSAVDILRNRIYEFY